MKRAFYVLLTIVTLFVGVGFALHNKQVIEINYYFGLRWNGPLSLALLTAFALGAIAGWLASLRTVVRMQRQLVQTRKEVRQMEQEVANVRALPIKDVI